MKIFVIAILLTLITLAGCSDSLSPTESPDFSEIQFKFNRWSGMGIPMRFMEIYKSGWVRIDLNIQGEWKEGSEISMSSDEMKIFRKIESDFSLYDNLYEPEKFFTDQEYHRIVLMKEIPDTTRVYSSGGSNLPESLKNGIKIMEVIAKRVRDGLEG